MNQPTHKPPTKRLYLCIYIIYPHGKPTFVRALQMYIDSSSKWGPDRETRACGDTDERLTFKSVDCWKNHTFCRTDFLPKLDQSLFLNKAMRPTMVYHGLRWFAMVYQWSCQNITNPSGSSHWLRVYASPTPHALTN